MKARRPDTGYAVNEGVRLYYEVHGTGPISILLVPPWAVTTAAFWKIDAREVFDRIRCPVLLIHGLSEDYPIETFVAYRGLPQSTLVTMMTPGHLPNVRDPVTVNLILRRFFNRVASAEAA